MQSNCYFLDTSFLSALVNPKDVHHTQAKAQFEILWEADELYVSSVVLIEVLMLIPKIKGLNWSVLHDMIVLLNVEIKPLEEHFVDGLAQFITRTKLALKPNDYTILFSAVQLDAQLLTYDQELQHSYSQLQS